jgi:hypothetical protein
MTSGLHSETPPPLARRARCEFVRATRYLAISLALCFAGCSLFLDFEDLTSQISRDAGLSQSAPDGGFGASAGGFEDAGTTPVRGGTGGAAPAGGGADSGGEGGSAQGGAAGAGAACTCPDLGLADACQQPVCNPAGECSAPAFVREYSGIVGSTLVRALTSTLVAGGDKFYLAIYGERDTATDAELWSLDPTDRNPVAVAGANLRALLAPGELVGSRVALVPIAEDAVVGLFAISSQGNSRIGRVGLNRDLGSPQFTVINRPYFSPTNVGPVAASTDAGQLFAAWPSPDGIAFHSEGLLELGVSELVRAGEVPLALAAIPGSSSPVVAWALPNLPAAFPDTPVLRLATFVPNALGTGFTIALRDSGACSALSGLLPGALRANPAPDSSAFVFSLSPTTGPNPHGQSFDVTCPPGATCLFTGPLNEAACETAVVNGASDLAIHRVRPLAGNADFAVMAAALPTEDTSATSALSLLGPAPARSTVGVAEVLSAQPRADLTARNHELAIWNDKVAVTWTEPNPIGSDLVRLARYRICFPP